MTREEIAKEMEYCKQRIDKIGKEVEAESNFSVNKPKLDEMMELCKRASDLHAMNQKLLETELREGFKGLIDRLFKDLG